MIIKKDESRLCWIAYSDGEPLCNLKFRDCKVFFNENCELPIVCLDFTDELTSANPIDRKEALLLKENLEEISDILVGDEHIYKYLNKLLLNSKWRFDIYLRIIFGSLSIEELALVEFEEPDVIFRF